MFIPLHDANPLRHIRRQYVTFAIIAANIAIWLMVGANPLFSSEGARASFLSFGFIASVANGYEVLPPQFERVPEAATYVTYAFMHADFWHLAGNMLFIWVFGDNVEDAMGHVRYALFFLACAAAGAWAHALATPYSNSPLIGASGAASGLVSAYVLLHPRVRVWVLAFGRLPLRLGAMWVIGAWILFQIANFVLLPDSQVSFAAHIGGILAGVILLPFLKRRDVRLFDRKPVDVVSAGAALAGEPKPEPPGPWGKRVASEPSAPVAEPAVTSDAKRSRWGRQ